MEKIVDYFVELIRFPNHKVKEAVTENEDGTYTIFIEESLSRCEQQNALLHALRHIIGDDFQKEDIQTIERQAHRMEVSDELCPTVLERVKVGIA